MFKINFLKIHKNVIFCQFFPIFWSPLSNCRGGVNYQIFSFFPSTSIYYHTPICKDFEKIRPPWLLPTPPGLIENRWKNIFCSSGRFLSIFFNTSRFLRQFYTLKNKNMQLWSVLAYLRLSKTLSTVYL